MINQELTEMETKVIKSLNSLLEGNDPGFSDIDIECLSYETKIAIKTLRGVIGSLVKKDIIWPEYVDINGKENCFYIFIQDGKIVNNILF